MPPTILQVDPVRPDAEIVRRAVAALAAGDLVILPTETVYGLAADPAAPGAVDRLYEAKGRRADKPVALLADGIARVWAYGAEFSEVAATLSRVLWPGPLTLVLRGPGGFEGFRVPDHPVARAVLRAAGRVLAVSSANRSGEPAPVDCAAAVAAIGDRAALALDSGPSPGGVASTVVRVDGARWDVIRPGPIRAEGIARILGSDSPQT